MIAVALFATLLGTVHNLMSIAAERQYRFRKLAGDYVARAQALGLSRRIPINTPKGARMALTRFGQIVEDSPETLRLERQYWWLLEMSDKYAQAASLPLLPAGPDPTEPKGMPSGASDEP